MAKAVQLHLEPRGQYTEQGKEYHVDSRNWAWTWVSPDLWFEHADAPGSFEVHVRLRNNGNADAQGISVDLEYRPGNTIDGVNEWFQLRDESQNLQRVLNANLAMHSSNEWILNWKPERESVDGTYSLRARVVAPGDPNLDDKSAVSTMGIQMFGDQAFVDVLVSHSRTKHTFVPRLTEGSHVAFGSHRGDPEAHESSGGDTLNVCRVVRAHSDDWCPRPSTTDALEELPNSDGRYLAPSSSIPAPFDNVSAVTVRPQRSTDAEGATTIFLLD